MDGEIHGGFPLTAHVINGSPVAAQPVAPDSDEPRMRQEVKPGVRTIERSRLWTRGLVRRYEPPGAT